MACPVSGTVPCLFCAKDTKLMKNESDLSVTLAIVVALFAVLESVAKSKVRLPSPDAECSTYKTKLRSHID